MNTSKTKALFGALLVTLAIAPAVGAADNLEPIDLARQLNQAFIGVADKVSPSVVVISLAHKVDFEQSPDNPLWDWLPPEFRKQMQERFRQRGQPKNHPPVFDAQGSGIVLREDGYILTNGHVVEGAEKIKVRLKDGKEYDGEVRGTDPQSDIAVVKIDATGLPAAKFANSDKVRVGEFAIAIGAPFDLDYSVTFGHVSAKGRSRIIPDPSMDQDFIQTDANINPGNSGGPLVNIDGQVIGMNTLIRGLHTGIGFAIPSNLAMQVADKLVAEGKFTRAWLGVEIRALSEDTEYRELVKGVRDGVVVRGIVQDGPASKSDLKLGDVITAVDEKPVATAQQLRDEIRAKRIDSDVALSVVRGGNKIEVNVKPEEWPQDDTPVANRRSPAAAAESTDLGITVKPLTKDLAKELGEEYTEGLVVTEVDPDSAAARKGIAKGDILTEINQSPVVTLKQFNRAAQDADLKKGVVLNLVRDGVSRFVILKDSGE